MSIPARNHHGLGRVHEPRGTHHVRGDRQVPGRDVRAQTVFHSRPRTVFHDVRPRHTHSVSFIHTSGGRVSSLATLIVGLALTILGACILPVDPVGGILFGGLGLLLTAAGAAAYSRGRQQI